MSVEVHRSQDTVCILLTDIIGWDLSGWEASETHGSVTIKVKDANMLRKILNKLDLRED